jgi:hypothetical protein
MARRLTLIHQRRQHELADPESKFSKTRDPDLDPYAKVDAQRDRREDRDVAAPTRPAAPRITKKKKKKKLKKAA